MEKAAASGVKIGNEAESGVENGPITKWIERYYEEKLDKRDKKSGPGAYPGKAKGLLAQLLYLN
jgi:hypothetical protein